jgi:predicted aspartyl protease
VPRNWASFTALSLPIVAVLIGGTIVRALADTGASQSLIDPHLVKQLGVAEKGSGWIVGIVASPIQVPLVSVAGVSIGQCSLKPFKAGVIDLANLRIGVQLVLGINAFVGYRLQFDFAEGRLYLLS